MKQGLRAPHSRQRGPRKPREKNAAFRLHASQQGTGGAGSGWGKPAEGSSPRSPEFVFAFGPTAKRMPGGVVWAAAGSRLVTGGDARLEGPRTTDPYSACAAGAGFAFPGPAPERERARRPRILRELTRGDLRAPLAGLPAAPRGRGKCARPACVELPGTRRRPGWPFVYSETEGAPVCTPPPGLFSGRFHGGGFKGLSRKQSSGAKPAELARCRTTQTVRRAAAICGFLLDIPSAAHALWPEAFATGVLVPPATAAAHPAQRNVNGPKNVSGCFFPLKCQHVVA